MRRAEGVVDGDWRAEGRSNLRAGVEICVHRKARRGHSRNVAGLVYVDGAQCGTGRDLSVHGRVTHDQLSCGGAELTLRVHRETAVAGEGFLAVGWVLNDEKSIALKGHVGSDAGRRD